MPSSPAYASTRCTTSSGNGTRTREHTNMNCTMRCRNPSSRVARASANSSGPIRGTWLAGTTKPVIDSMSDSIRSRCRLVSRPPAATAAATAPATIRASVASGGVCLTRSGLGSGTGIGASTSVRGSLFLHELDQRAECALRVHEGHGGPAAAGAGLLVDGAAAVRLHRGERLGTVVDPVADVMQPLTLGGEVFGDR